MGSVGRAGICLLLFLPWGIQRAQAPDAPAPDRWLGTWRLDPERSVERAAAPYKRVTFTIAPLPPGVRVSYDMVDLRGEHTHIEWDGAFDGLDHIVQGVDYVLTNAYRKIGENSYEVVIRVDGGIAARTRAVVSGDGATLTAVTTETGADGTPLRTTNVYERVGDGLR